MFPYMKQCNTLNADKLNSLIEDRGLKKKYIAKKMGISEQLFYKKMAKKCNFSGEQVRIAKKILSLTDSQVVEIFFADNVSNMETTTLAKEASNEC